jgi:GGDEF domain-containing protein
LLKNGNIGVASLNEKINNFEKLIKTADEALYISKKDGKNCVRSNQNK